MHQADNCFPVLLGRAENKDQLRGIFRAETSEFAYSPGGSDFLNFIFIQESCLSFYTVWGFRNTGDNYKYDFVAPYLHLHANIRRDIKQCRSSKNSFPCHLSAVAPTADGWK